MIDPHEAISAWADFFSSDRAIRSRCGNSSRKVNMVTITMVNFDVHHPVRYKDRGTIAHTAGAVLCASDMHAHNTFDQPNTVTSVPLALTMSNGGLNVALPAGSVLIEFLPRDDDEDRARGIEAIGYMFAFAQWTDTRMLALVGDPQADAYELLFSFSSPVNKAEFLSLLQSNDETRCEENMILIPRQDEIEAAQPIARVLPADVMQQVTIVAAMLRGGNSDMIQ